MVQKKNQRQGQSCRNIQTRREVEHEESRTELGVKQPNNDKRDRVDDESETELGAQLTQLNQVYIARVTSRARL